MRLHKRQTMKRSLLSATAAFVLISPALAATPDQWTSAEWNAKWAELDIAIKQGWANKAFDECSPVHDADPHKDYMFCITTYVTGGYTFTISIDHQLYGHEPAKWLRTICDDRNYCARDPGKTH